ncbi:MAG: GNAT family N-acetyltransferase [Pseudomonadota bacterium]
MIRPARVRDLPRIAEIHAQAWHSAYADIIPHNVLAQITPQARLPVWQSWFAEASFTVAVYDEDGEVLGFTLICPARDVASPPPGYGELSHLYLDPQIIGRGIGNRLFEAAASQLQAEGYAGMLLWTLEKNTRARKFYEARNMAHDGARQDEPDWLGPDIYEVRYVMQFSRP